MHARAATTTCLAALALTSVSTAQPSPSRPRDPAATTPAVAASWRKLAMLRVMGGGTNIRGAGSDATTQWTIDVHAGLRLVDTSRRGAYWIFGADVGVSLGPRGADTESLWLGGGSVSYGGAWLSLGWSPRFVFGSVQQQTSLGVRNTISACALLGAVCLDAAHQYLSIGDGSQQDIRLAMGLDLGLIAQMLVQFADARPG